jgi:uncharacterized protein (DUF3820 family)
MSRSYEDKPIPFGKHKGKLICDIATSYLEWLSEQDFFEEEYSELFDLVEQELEYRRMWGL